jgi:predicted nucleic-acid-binding Zn-ribbon protein
MIQEATQNRYLGVSCSRCEEPIPIPKRVAVLYEKLQRGQAKDAQEVSTNAFTIRCKACDGESVYSVDRIREFEGSARTRKSKAVGA